MSKYEEDFEDSSSSSSSVPSSPQRLAPRQTPVAVTAAPLLSSRAAAALASGEWRAQSDPTTGKAYYYHVATHKTTWDLNEELRSTASTTSSSTSSSSAMEVPDESPHALTDTSKKAAKPGEGERPFASTSSSSTTRHSSDEESSEAPQMTRRERRAAVYGGLPDTLDATQPRPGSLSVNPPTPVGGSKKERNIEDFVAFQGGSGSAKRDPEESGEVQPQRSTGTNTTINSHSKESRHTTTTSTSDDATISAALLQRKMMAAEAAEGEEYHTLQKFVAFGAPGSTQSSSNSNVRNPAGDNSTIHSSSHVLQDTPTESPTNAAAKEAKTAAPAVLSSGEPAVKTADQSEGKKEASQPKAESAVSDGAPSSLFSSLSQHLKTNDVPPLSPKAVKSPAASSVLSELPQPVQVAIPADIPPAENTAVQSATPPILRGDEKGLASTRTTTNAPPLPPAILKSSPLQPAVQMTVSPLQPIPSLSAHLGTPSTKVVVSSSPTASPAVFTSPFSHSPLTAASPSGGVPLPLTTQQKEEQKEQLEHERRMQELRETSTAVERLVAAFAGLRGYPPAAESAPPAWRLKHHTLERLDTLAAHRAGAAATVQTTRHHAKPAVPQKGLPSHITRDEQRDNKPREDSQVATVANEKLLEQALQEYILSVMASSGVAKSDEEAVPKPSSAMGGASASDAQRPPFRPRRDHICISADEFSFHHQGSSRDALTAEMIPRGRPRTHLSVFDGEMSAFAPHGLAEDRDADVAVQKAVGSALEKYFWSRVLRPPGSREAAIRQQLATLVPFITPYVAWVMLLDLISCLRDIIEWGFIGTDQGCGYSSSSVDYPILIRFDGPAALDEMARATLHCLPFEAVGTDGYSHPEDGGQRRGKNIFRLEYWVNRERLFSVLDAVHRSLRHHLVVYGGTLHYSPFTDETETICNPNGVVPPHAPYFTVVPPPPPPAGSKRWARGEEPRYGPSKPGSRWASRTRGNAAAETKEDDFFGVGGEAVERLAHAVSSLATDVLTKENTHVPRGAASQSITGEEDGAGMKSAPSNDMERTFLEGASDFPRLCTIIAETACELFQDVGIRAAIERRAAEKMQAYYAVKGRYARSSRLDKERQLIEQAEAEAEGVVTRILQELYAQQVKESRSLHLKS